jgi:uncharacterized protein
MLGVAVGDLRSRPIGSQQAVSLRVPAEDLADLGLSDDLQVTGQATNLGDDGVRVELHVETALNRECARCLREVRLQLQAEAEETFHESGDEPLITAETIDLEPIVHEAVVLAEPMRVLCSPDCRGLCPKCGKDLNEGPCGCADDDQDPRLAPLAKLLPPREE